MNGLLEYKRNLQYMSVEELLNELDTQAYEESYHRFCSRNSELEKERQDKKMLVKLEILSRY